MWEKMNKNACFCNDFLHPFSQTPFSAKPALSAAEVSKNPESHITIELTDPIPIGLFLCGECLFDNVAGFLYTFVMSPTIFCVGNYRFYFFSREEERIHIHVVSPEGEAKFWVEPIVALVTYTGFSKRQLARLQRIVEEHKNEIVKAWRKHFKA